MTEPRDIGDIFREGTAIDAAMAKAAEAAGREALAWGQPLVCWKDGRVVEVWPDELPPRAKPAEKAAAAD